MSSLWCVVNAGDCSGVYASCKTAAAGQAPTSAGTRAWLPCLLFAVCLSAVSVSRVVAAYAGLGFRVSVVRPPAGSARVVAGPGGLLCPAELTTVCLHVAQPSGSLWLPLDVGDPWHQLTRCQGSMCGVAACIVMFDGVRFGCVFEGSYCCRWNAFEGGSVCVVPRQPATAGKNWQNLVRHGLSAVEQ